MSETDYRETNQQWRDAMQSERADTPTMTGDRIPSPRAVRMGAEFIDVRGEDATLSADAVDAVAALLTRIHETWGDLPISVKLNATILGRAITERD